MENLKFQSTRPSRGATGFYRRHEGGLRISIHAPLAGRDRRSISTGYKSTGQFQSTRPSRGATANVHKNHVHIGTNTQKKYVFLSNTVCQSA